MWAEKKPELTAPAFIWSGMIQRKLALLAAPAVLVLAGCAADEEAAGDVPSPSQSESSQMLPPPGWETGSPAAGTRPAGQPNEIVKVGRIEAGVECPILRTSAGETYALSLGDADFGPGDYVRISGELADASICMQGKGTLIPLRIEPAGPPA